MLASDCTEGFVVGTTPVYARGILRTSSAYHAQIKALMLSAGGYRMDISNSTLVYQKCQSGWRSPGFKTSRESTCGL